MGAAARAPAVVTSPRSPADPGVSHILVCIFAPRVHPFRPCKHESMRAQLKGARRRTLPRGPLPSPILIQAYFGETSSDRGGTTSQGCACTVPTVLDSQRHTFKNRPDRPTPTSQLIPRIFSAVCAPHVRRTYLKERWAVSSSPWREHRPRGGRRCGVAARLRRPPKSHFLLILLRIPILRTACSPCVCGTGL